MGRIEDRKGFPFRPLEARSAWDGVSKAHQHLFEGYLAEDPILIQTATMEMIMSSVQLARAFGVAVESFPGGKA